MPPASGRRFDLARCRNGRRRPTRADRVHNARYRLVKAGHGDARDWDDDRVLAAYQDHIAAERDASTTTGATAAAG